MEKPKIIVADSNKNTNIKLKDVLERLNYHVIGISLNSADFFNTIFASLPDLVLIDINFSGKYEGIETAEKIIKTFKVPIIFLIENIEKNALERLVKIKSYGYIFKPFNSMAIQVTIETALYQSENDKIDTKLESKGINESTVDVLKTQKSILPRKSEVINNININWLFFPSSKGSGDIFNYYELGKYHIAFYLLDVMGHGFQAALTSTTLHRYLYPDANRGGIVNRLKDNTMNNLRRRKDDHLPSIVSPKEVIIELNERFYESSEKPSFFTIIYGIINTITHETKLARAGHHYPSYQTPDGEIRLLKSAGTALGFSRDIEIEEYVFKFEKGARLYLYSDGLIEIKNKNLTEFSVSNLHNFFTTNKDLPLNDTLLKLEDEIIEWAGYKKFADDIALLALERIE